MDLTVEFKGLETLKKAFDLLPKRVAVRAASKAVRAGAKIIHRAARSNVPVDTGNLRQSIAIKVLNKKREAMEVTALIGPKVKYRRSTNKGRTRYNENLRNDGFYGFFVEYGTKDTTAQPWLRPAFDENKVAAQQAILDIIGEEIERQAAAYYGSK